MVWATVGGVTPADLLGFLIGSAAAIRRLAESRATLPAGVALVLMTAVARSYDQTWIGESPALWIFGPLLFSLVSGTWLFVVVYLGLLRRGWEPVEKTRSGWKDWPAFMGLYWMTAPSAWLYAIPVERFLDDMGSARANLVLLGGVSLWRVLLFSRVVAVIGTVRYAMALVWVLLAASIEAFVILFLTSFGEAVGRGMGGLRNSPAQDLILGVLSGVTAASFVVGLVTLVVSVLWRPRVPTTRLAGRRPGSVPWVLLLVLGAFWIVVAVLVQPDLRRNAEVDRLVKEDHHREVITFLAKHTPTDFAPGRPLPPKPYERATFRQLARLLDQLRPEDPPWVRQHFERRADDVVESFQRRRHPTGASGPTDPESADVSWRLSSWVLGSPDDIRMFVEGVLGPSWPAGWRERHRAFLVELATHLSEQGAPETLPIVERLEKSGFRPRDRAGTRRGGDVEAAKPEVAPAVPPPTPAGGTP